MEMNWTQGQSMDSMGGMGGVGMPMKLATDEPRNLAQQARELNESIGRAHNLLDRLTGVEGAEVKAIPMGPGGGVGAEVNQAFMELERLCSRLAEVVQRVGRL